MSGLTGRIKRDEFTSYSAQTLRESEKSSLEGPESILLMEATKSIRMSGYLKDWIPRDKALGMDSIFLSSPFKLLDLVKLAR